MEAKAHYFYVLHCADQSLYGGYTTDLKRREEEHQSGCGAKYTRPASRRPLKMIYAEQFQTRSQATKAEYAFKRLSRPQKNAYLKAAGIQDPTQQKQIVTTIKEAEFHSSSEVLSK